MDCSHDLLLVCDGVHYNKNNSGGKCTEGIVPAGITINSEQPQTAQPSSNTKVYEALKAEFMKA